RRAIAGTGAGLWQTHQDGYPRLAQATGGDAAQERGFERVLPPCRHGEDDISTVADVADDCFGGVAMQYIPIDLHAVLLAEFASLGADITGFQGYHFAPRRFTDICAADVPQRGDELQVGADPLSEPGSVGGYRFG